MRVAAALGTWMGLFMIMMGLWMPTFMSQRSLLRALERADVDRKRFDEAYWRRAAEAKPVAEARARESRTQCENLARSGRPLGEFDHVWLKFCRNYPDMGLIDVIEVTKLALLDVGLSKTPPIRESIADAQGKVMQDRQRLMRWGWMGLSVWIGVGIILLGFVNTRPDLTSRPV